MKGSVAWVKHQNDWAFPEKWKLWFSSELSVALVCQSHPGHRSHREFQSCQYLLRHLILFTVLFCCWNNSKQSIQMNKSQQYLSASHSLDGKTASRLNIHESEHTPGDSEVQGRQHAAVHGITKSWTSLSNWTATMTISYCSIHIHTHVHIYIHTHFFSLYLFIQQDTPLRYFYVLALVNKVYTFSDERLWSFVPWIFSLPLNILFL